MRRAVGVLEERFPDLRFEVTSDDAVFIRGSIREVLTTLALALGIVVLVLWLFLGRLGVTLIPALAIPVALIGSVAAIWLLGFSINLITLLALVLATGLVVDDSIVVTENIQRRRAEGMGAKAAAVLGTRQVFFAVIATTLTLIAVFVPISFLPSDAGRLFSEFGFVLAVTVALSSFVALSLCPMIAARLPSMGGERRGIVGWVGARLAAWLRGAAAPAGRGAARHGHRRMPARSERRGRVRRAGRRAGAGRGPGQRDRPPAGAGRYRARLHRPPGRDRRGDAVALGRAGCRRLRSSPSPGAMTLIAARSRRS